MTTPQEAAQHLLKLKRASESFLGFIQLHHPEWKLQPFHLRLIEDLDKLERGELRNAKGERIHRVMINWPPRHGKTAIVTVSFHAYFIARDPRRAGLSVAYNGTLAEDFGAKVREMVEHPYTLQAFSEARRGHDLALDLDKRSAAKDFWRTTKGGQVAHTGVGGTTTGRPAELLLIDDPIKDRSEAESATYRNKTWNFYTGSLITRKQPQPNGQPPIEIVIQTRWHPDDLSGRIQATESWKDGEWLHFNERALSRQPTGRRIPPWQLGIDDPDYMSVKDWQQTGKPKSEVLVPEFDDVALWPSQKSVKELRDIERTDRRDFESLYQQNPFIEGGNIIKAGWWRHAETPDHTELMTIIISCDTASKTKTFNDHSVLMVLGMTRFGDIHILDIIRGKWEFPDLKRIFSQQNTKWRGRGLRAFYVEDKSSGTQIVQELRRQAGISVIPHGVSHDKVTRVKAITPVIEGGRVYLDTSAPWADGFISECAAFGPGAKEDDQVDALSMGLDILSRIPVSNAESPFDTWDAQPSLNKLAADQPSLNHLLRARWMNP